PRPPPRHEGSVVGIGELDEPGTVGEVRHDLACQPQRQPRLADAPRSAQGQRADSTEQPGKLSQIPLPPEEAVWLPRKIPVTNRGLDGHGPFVLVAVTAGVSMV